MSQGTITKLFATRGVGVIDTGNKNELVFHFSVLKGARVEELRIGQQVAYEVGERSTRPHAKFVRTV